MRSTDNDNATNGKSDFKYETTNGSNLKLLDTPSIDGLDKITINSLELAAMRGRFSFQSEFTQASAQRDMAADLDFSAWYLQAGYTLTGESRSYKGSDGEFKRLKPATEFSLEKGTWGAWEVAARLDHLDLDDGPATSGGSGDRYTLALNWYLNYNVRVMADYSRVYNLDNGPVTRLNGADAENIDTFTLRTQWAF
jgi:phosphate-selective porin OprO/OprP